MNMEPVESEAIHSVGYDPATKTLRVRFHTGNTYDYPNVPADEHRAFMDAGSMGKHFARHFRNHEQTRVE